MRRYRKDYFPPFRHPWEEYIMSQPKPKPVVSFNINLKNWETPTGSYFWIVMGILDYFIIAMLAADIESSNGSFWDSLILLFFVGVTAWMYIDALAFKLRRKKSLDISAFLMLLALAQTPIGWIGIFAITSWASRNVMVGDPANSRFHHQLWNELMTVITVTVLTGWMDLTPMTLFT